MRKIVKMRDITRLAAVMLAFALVFAFSPEEAYAAAKAPAKVTGVSAHAAGSNAVTVKWKKAKKGAKGYAVYCNGDLVARIGGAKRTSYTVGGLEPGTNYSFAVRSYKTVKKKMWLNKQTGAYQAKKPPKRIRGKAKKRTDYKYGKYSTWVSARTSGVQPVGSRDAWTLDPDTFDAEMLRQINAQRAAAGVPAVRLDPVMCYLAWMKAYDMYLYDYFDHTSPTWGDPFEQYQDANILGLRGENIAYGQRSISQAMNSWMNSSGHRANILARGITDVGVAYIGGYWVQQFGTDPSYDINCPECGHKVGTEEDYLTASFAYGSYNDICEVYYIKCRYCGEHIYFSEDINELESKLTVWESKVPTGSNVFDYIVWKDSSGQTIPQPIEFEMNGQALIQSEMIIEGNAETSDNRLSEKKETTKELIPPEKTEPGAAEICNQAFTAETETE